jgi:hypothetical protein
VYGFQAIAHHNGWAMAVAGALIVMSGLAALSFIISQFPRLIRFFDKEKGAQKELPSAQESAMPSEPGIPDRCPADINAAGELYRRFTGKLGDSFELTDLYRACLEKNLPHPHLTIKCLREAGLLIPTGEGLFIWKD